MKSPKHVTWWVAGLRVTLNLPVDVKAPGCPCIITDTLDDIINRRPKFRSVDPGLASANPDLSSLQALHHLPVITNLITLLQYQQSPTTSLLRSKRPQDDVHWLGKSLNAQSQHHTPSSPSDPDPRFFSTQETCLGIQSRGRISRTTEIVALVSSPGQILTSYNNNHSNHNLV